MSEGCGVEERGQSSGIVVVVLELAVKRSIVFGFSFVMVLLFPEKQRWWKSVCVCVRLSELDWADVIKLDERLDEQRTFLLLLQRHLLEMRGDEAGLG